MGRAKSDDEMRTLEARFDLHLVKPGEEADPLRFLARRTDGFLAAIPDPPDTCDGGYAKLRREARLMNAGHMAAITSHHSGRK